MHVEARGLPGCLVIVGVIALTLAFAFISIGLMVRAWQWITP